MCATSRSHLIELCKSVDEEKFGFMRNSMTWFYSSMLNLIAPQDTFTVKPTPDFSQNPPPLSWGQCGFDEQNSSNDPDDRGWYNPDFFAQTTLKNDVFLIKPAPLLSSQFIFIFEHFKDLLTVEKSDFPVHFLVGGCLEIYAACVLFRLRGSATFEKKSHMSS